MLRHAWGRAVADSGPLRFRSSFPDGSPVQALRRMAKKQITSKHCPVVAIIRKKGSVDADSSVAFDALSPHQVHVLIVLTGNGNDRYTKVRGYDYIINITWAANRESNPTWLPP